VREIASLPHKQQLFTLFSYFLVVFQAYSSTLRLQAVRCLETSLNLFEIRGCCPEDLNSYENMVEFALATWNEFTAARS
jgi:hypothetical protein